MLAETGVQQESKYIRWLEEVHIEDVPLVGGKNAALGEMYREFKDGGVKIPNGFAVTAEGYWHVIEAAGILDQLQETMSGLDKTKVVDLATRGKRARDLILSAGIPEARYRAAEQHHEALLFILLGLVFD